jgi:predicted amidophosphoribosyltransferase
LQVAKLVDKVNILSVEIIKPRRLQGGPWTEGYALHIHMLSSSFVGYDQKGHARFDSLRSPIGELLYRLKYQQDRTAVDQLAEAAECFLKTWKPPIDAIVPVPPSLVRRNQPVLAVARALAERLRIPLWASCLSKIKKTPQLKDIVEYDKRAEALKGAFTVAPEQTAGKTLLLFDDLYGSGATVSHIVDVLKNQGGAKAVYLLTLTTK